MDSIFMSKLFDCNSEQKSIQYQHYNTLNKFVELITLVIFKPLLNWQGESMLV
jgi:hypothetical protein